MKYRTPHGVIGSDAQKIKKMVGTLRSGGTLPAIQAVYDEGDRIYYCLEGTHRLQAYAAANIIPVIVTMDYGDTPCDCEDEDSLTTVAEVYDYYHGDRPNGIDIVINP